MLKFLLIPLLIVGMFVSFAAALMAMLFFTKTIESPQELEDIVLGKVDSTRLSDDFVDPEDKLGRLYAFANEYRSLYEKGRERNEVLLDSLVTEKSKLRAKEDSLHLEAIRLGQKVSDERLRALTSGVEELATFYNKMKPAPAAEILQNGTLGDTTVAMIMRKLAPKHMAKIMANMNANYAAVVSKLIQEIPAVQVSATSP